MVVSNVYSGHQAVLLLCDSTTHHTDTSTSSLNHSQCLGSKFSISSSFKFYLFDPDALRLCDKISGSREILQGAGVIDGRGCEGCALGKVLKDEMEHLMEPRTRDQDSSPSVCDLLEILISTETLRSLSPSFGDLSVSIPAQISQPGYFTDNERQLSTPSPPRDNQEFSSLPEDHAMDWTNLPERDTGQSIVFPDFIDPAHEHDIYGNDNNFITRNKLQMIQWYAANDGPWPPFPRRNMTAASNIAVSASNELPDVLTPRISNDEKHLVPGKAYMAAEQRTEEDILDCDLRSVHFLDTFRDSALGSSLPSNMSISTLQGLPRTAQEEILLIIISDLELRGLFEEAARRIDKSRLVRKIRRLFLLFHQDLQANATDLRELDALRIIQRHSQWLASRLFDICNPNSGSKTEVIATYLNQQLDKRPMLENYLATMGAGPNQVNHSKPE
ncbi:hypothetical protein DL98DRAFT_575583, partial [Cadophora sp. DSE1049]